MIVRISNLDASPLYYSAAVIPASRGGWSARRPPPESSKAYDRERLFPIVTRNGLSLDIRLIFFFFDNRTHVRSVVHATVHAYTHGRCTHASERDASRAAALNYRPDAILMRSIIYGARHRPLNIPRSTKESSRYPGIIPGQYSRIVCAEVQTRYSHRAAIFAELLMALGKSGRGGEGGSRGRGICHGGGRIPSVAIDPREEIGMIAGCRPSRVAKLSTR